MPELGFLATSFGAWGAALLSLIGLFLRLFWGVNKDEGRGRWVAWLRHDGFARRYRAILNAGLDRLDRHLSPDFPQVPTDHAVNRKTEPARAWSARLLDLCLLLAVAYPFLAVVLDWAVRGEALDVGGSEVLPAGIEGWRRWFFAASFVLAFLTAMRASLRRTSRLDVVLASAVTLAFASAFMLVFSGVGEFAAAFVVAVTAVFAGALGSMVAASGAVIVAFIAVEMIVIVNQDVEAILTAVLIATITEKVLSTALGVSASILIVGSFSLLLAVIFSKTQNYIVKKQKIPTISLFIFSVFIFILLWFNLLYQKKSEVYSESAPILLFLGFFPILNAWADFASIGLTRWRLRIGVQHNLVANAIIDCFAALLILVALAFAMVATMYLVRTSDGVPLYDAAALLADLRAQPGNYWWLAFMLFSTLLPTLAHLAIGAFALFTLASGWLGRPIAAGLMKGDSPEGRIASLALSIAAALAVWLPCLLLWFGLKHGGAPLLDALLWSCERFLALLQASFPIRAAG